MFRTDCLDGWLSHDDSCYLFVLDTDYTRHAAKDHCVSQGAHLVSIQNEAEFMFVTSNIKGVIETSGLELGDIQLWWTGGRRLTTGQFGWEDGLHGT